VCTIRAVDADAHALSLQGELLEVLDGLRARGTALGQTIILDLACGRGPDSDVQSQLDAGQGPGQRNQVLI
jgi:hypothetical protein